MDLTKIVIKANFTNLDRLKSELKRLPESYEPFVERTGTMGVLFSEPEHAIHLCPLIPSVHYGEVKLPDGASNIIIEKHIHHSANPSFVARFMLCETQWYIYRSDEKFKNH